MSFSHLHVHSHYSLLEATATPKQLAKQAQAFGQTALALTDHGNMFGVIEFYFACQDQGVKPIIGLDAYMAPFSRLQKGEHRETVQGSNKRLVFLAMNMEGYKNLCKISSIGYQEGFYYKPRIDLDVIKANSAGLICLSGSQRGVILQTYTQFGAEKALEQIREFKTIFDDRFYLEIQRTQVPGQLEFNQFLIEASKITGVQMVATNDVHYLQRDDSRAQEVLLCIGGNKTLQDETRYRLGSQEYFLKSSDQMEALFSDLPEAIANTQVIADRTALKFKLKDDSGRPIYHLPTFPTQNGRSVSEEMTVLCEAGLLDRFKEAETRGEAVPEDQKPQYYERLKYEIGVIDQMGFVGYFLIVQDFINWAKSKDIPVGPGRGSGAGSLASYCLKITDLDPIRNFLLFERFLNPERVSMPDFDIDFCQFRRGEVIEYVNQKYSPPCVSQIITFGKLQAKAAIRDVGRVLGMTFAEVDVIAKLIPEKLGITLKEAIETEPRLTEAGDMDPKIANLLALAQKIEGLNRHASIHAAGVIISDKALVEHAPLYKTEDGAQVVQFDMKNSEKIGLIKFDFLGLKTLTLIDEALKLIKKNRGKSYTTTDISMSDPGVYEVMGKGDTAGIFQFEGSGITDLIRQVKPSEFADLVAINALYRPGPMQMLPDYIARKAGKAKVTYLFPQLEEILKETYGIIVYQEQVMLLASKIANYSLGEADMLRRAMGKKIKSEMDSQRARFLDGAQKNGLDVKKTEELFDLVAKFAEYGFNKSHAAAYCVVAVQTAWLKAHYKVEFFASMLTTEMGDTDKMVWYCQDAREHGLVVRSPHVNYSEYQFNAVGEEIFFGLGGIKGVGEAAVEAILEARSAKPAKKFDSLEDFFESIDLRRVNKKVVECLIKAGALDDFGAHRAQLIAVYPRLIEMADQKRSEKEVGQTNLFDFGFAASGGSADGTLGPGGAENENTFQFPNVPEWKRMEKLGFEKDVLGFYLSDHPLRGLEALFSPFVNMKVKGLSGAVRKQKVILAGMMTSAREVMTKKGTRMAFGQFEDATGSVELVIFPDTYAKYEKLVQTEIPVLIEGAVEVDAEAATPRAKILVEAIKSVDDQLGQLKEVVVRIENDIENQLDRLRDVLMRNKGDVGLSFRMSLPENGQMVILKSNQPQGLKPSRAFFDDVQQSLGRTDFIELR
ncbi:MAG: DNA polymerase III subunit alpha [Bdellovibrionales bacterium]|nr:DNA polymerase III subunit alpha [Bdellovibrionales bacterium]